MDNPKHRHLKLLEALSGLRDVAGPQVTDSPHPELTQERVYLSARELLETRYEFTGDAWVN